ncbi:MAG TPA: methyl-accepting chemotaxis protein [Polyangiales bacterium]|nr:methyl-accepting chemotaxis protein [Polyangiales bacterium]
MTTEVESISGRPLSSSHPKRRWRNYLLVPSFQLKYTAMVVGVTVVVASVLGIQAYNYSRGQTELLAMNRMAAKGTSITDEFVQDLEAYSEQADRRVALSILFGVALLAVALGATGIIVTHRLVGPAYRLKMLLRDVSKGRLVVRGRLRKGDELQDIFEAFQEMIVSLRSAQEKEIALLEAAIDRAKAAGVPPDAIADIESVRDRMRAALD